MKKFIMLIGILALMLGLFATEVVIGDGTLTQRFPLGSFYGYERSAALYTAAEIGPQNTKISAVSWYSNIATTAEVPTKIYLKTTSAITLTTDNWANMISGAVLLYDSPHTGTEAGGWNLFTLMNDFNVDMGDNLMILVERNFGGGGSSSAGGSSAGGGIHSTAFTGGHLTWNADNNPPTGNGTVAANRPNVTITYTTYAIDTPPFPAAVISPADGATLVSPSATLNWGSGGGAPTGYKVHFGITNPPPFIQNTTEISYAPTMAVSTEYFWKIIPFNAIGDAPACPVWSFSTHGDPTITALPYFQDWDAVPVPTLPFDWTNIVQSSNVGALVATYASSSYVHSQPNCVRLYNPSDADATLLLVGPPVAPALNIGSVRVKFWGRSSGAGYPLSIGVMTDPTDPASYTEVHNLAMTTTVTEYVFSMASYTGTGNHIAFKHGLGGTGRSLYLDDIGFEQIAPNDLACEGLSGNTTPTVDNPTVYTASIHNWGTANQSTYTVKLFNGSNVELASAPGMTIAPDATVEIPMTWTPTVAGPVVLYAKVFLAGDINPVNDQSPDLNISVQAAGTMAVTIGDGSIQALVPMNFYYKNSLYECLFFADELGFTSGTITALAFYNTFLTDMPNGATKVWLGTTTQQDFSGGWIPSTQLTQVFDGIVQFPAGENTIVIPLTTPYMHTPGNLVMMVNRPLLGDYYSSSDKFFAQASATPRALAVNSDSTPYDPAAPPAGTTPSVNFPKTTIFYSGQAIVNDMGCLSISGNTTPSVGSATDYVVTVKNNGTAVQSNYQVKLFKEGDIEVGSVAGTTINSLQTLDFTVPWTPAATGPTFLYAKVVLAGDEIETNNQTANYPVNVQAAGTMAITVGAGGGTARMPMDFYWKNSMFQTVYLASELNTAGLLTNIQFYNSFLSTTTVDKPTNIWIGETTQTDLSGGWIPSTQLTQVFNGTVTYPSGPNDILIHLSTPYSYGGGNLVVMVQRPMDTDYYSSSDYFVTQSSDVASRTLNVTSDSVTYDPEVPPTGTTAAAIFPKTTFMFIAGGSGSINGTVTAGGNPLPGATVTVAGTPLTYTTTDTGAFNFPTVDAGTYNVTASMTGFNSQTLPVTVVSNGTSTLNFVLTTSSSVSEYSFTSAVGTYTQITTGTVLGTSANDQECFNAIPLGFAFNYNGAAYTEVSVMTNGFLAMGSEVLVANLPISSATASNNVVSAMTRDLKSRDDGELSYLLTGTAPNRVFTVQWKNYRRAPTSCTNDIINFQIQLHEDGDKAVFAYGNVNTVDATTAQTVQVGLRGNDNTSFNNRTTTESWIATTAGTVNNASCRISSTVFPPNGLVFTFSPAQQGTPPNPAQNPIPANNAVNVAVGTNLSWSTGGGNVDGYKLYFGTNNPPTNLVNGATQTGTVYDHPTNLVYSTPYYWKVVPFNADFEAPNCPVWQFTTLADPTITTYPYQQNFDAATPPALPLGWSAINANADAYTWETYAGNADTAPNSARIRYSNTVTMDDWLLTPPMTLVAGTNYLVKFSYRSNSATYPEALSVYTGTAPNAASLTNQIFTNTNITNATYEQAQITYTPTANGTYYVGFHGHSPANMFYLYLDTFSIEELTDVIDPPTNLTATVMNNSYVALDWDAPGDTPPPPPGFNDGFETYTDFAIAFDPWVMVDVDQSTTYGMTGTTWLNGYAAQAYIVFNPSATVPPLAALTTHGGAKMAACFAATTAPNNDWMISPLVAPTAGQFLNFYAKSYTAQYGLERFKVGISTTGATTPASFTIISGANYISAPEAWTLYSYDLSSYAGQSIRFGIQCVSNDAFFFMVDDVSVGPVPTSREHYASVPDLGTRTRNTGAPVKTPQFLNPPTREFLGYKVYRDGTLLTTIANTATTAYEDHDVTVGTYSYTVTAFYTGGESTPAGPVTATINPISNPPLDLTAAVDGNDVTLNWVSPEAPPTGDWITWCQDVLGNGIGTNSPIIFDVAHRFTQTDLAAHQGGAVTQVKFVPNYADCIYTVKVWTGGSATNAGTLVSSQVVPTIALGEWNLAVLNTPVTIPSTGDLYVGFEVNTQGDHPAGCDNGPVVEGKGNMMYFEGVWTTLTGLAASLTYNWSIQTFVADGAALKAVELTPIAEHQQISYATAPLTLETKPVQRANDRALAGFKVYRDDVLIGTISDPQVTTFSDMDLPNGTYIYGVTAVYTTGESAPATISVTVNVILAETIFQDDFEAYDNFALLFAPWTLLDVDLSPTYGISNVDFPGSAGPMAYIIFNPSATVPPITTLTPHSGAKMAASFAAVLPAEGGTGPNNDWMITPRMHMGTNSSIKFYARSHTAQYGLERFRVGVSMLPTIIPQGFQYVSPGDYVEAPAGWTEYIYDLSAYDNQNVWIGIRCVSNDAFVFYVDDFSVHSDGGNVVANDDPGIPALVTELQGNYPNPFNPRTTIRYSVKEATPVTIGIYNVKGQLVKTLVNEDKSSGNHSIVWDGCDGNNQAVSSGVYFYKMHAGKYSSTKKMILMK